MESDGVDNDRPTSVTATTPKSVWKLKRYGRFLPNGKVKTSGRGCAWKVRGRELSSAEDSKTQRKLYVENYGKRFCFFFMKEVTFNLTI